MSSLSETTKKIISIIACIYVVLNIGGYIAINFLLEADYSFTSYLMGTTLGTTFAILKIILLERTLTKAVEMPNKQATNYARAQYMVRYFLTGAMLLVAILNPSVNFLGAVLGLMSLQVAAYLVNFFLTNETQISERV